MFKKIYYKIIVLLERVKVMNVIAVTQKGLNKTENEDRSLTFWTVDEYETFLETMDESDHYYLMFEYYGYSRYS